MPVDLIYYSMVTSNDCLKKYGMPAVDNPFMTLFDVPPYLEVDMLPNKIWCNRDLIEPLTLAFTNIVDRNLVKEIVTWDGCFNIRTKRGLKSMSLHSWGIAVDINAFENQLGVEPKMSKELVACFEDAGFSWGGRWKRKDGMHFQLSKI